MIEQEHISAFNVKLAKEHSNLLDYTANILSKKGLGVKKIIDQIKAFQIAIPSWALGTGGTRFGRFPMGGEPKNLEEKIEDIGLLHALNKSSGAVSLHIPWDIPKDVVHIKSLAADHGI